jgi:hypothetical protein
MAKKEGIERPRKTKTIEGRKSDPAAPAPIPSRRPSALLDTRVIHCGDNLEQLAKLPDSSVDLIYIDPAPVSKAELPFNSNRNYEVFWGETKEKRAFEDRHASTQAYIDYKRPRPLLRPARPRPQEDRQLLLPLRLARFASIRRINLWHLSARQAAIRISVTWTSSDPRFVSASTTGRSSGRGKPADSHSNPSRRCIERTSSMNGSGLIRHWSMLPTKPLGA